MATKTDLTLHQGNDETITITITAADPGDDLTGITSLEVVLKPDACTDDDGTGALTLTTASAAQVEFVTQTADLVVAEAHVPASYLAEPYSRVWRVDAIGSTGERRTAVYGSVTVLDT